MKKPALLMFLAACTVSSLEAANWPQFRGPGFNGSSEEKNLPAAWSLTQNVVWKSTLPGDSASTPIVWDDHVFVSTTDTDTGKLKAMCFDRRSGELLWDHDVANGLRRENSSNYASPSPATDGRLVVFFYGNGDLVTCDYSGRELWSRNIQKDFGWFHFGWTFSSSPLLYDGKLILQVLQRDVAVRENETDGELHDSFLLALDPETGREIWKSVRPSNARAESREAFTTPTPFEHNGRRELLVIGGDALTGHDLTSGSELWRWETWNPERIGSWRHVPSPVASQGIVLVCAPKREPVYAIQTGGKGRLDDSAIAWKSGGARSGISADVPTPAFYDGSFFVLLGPNRGQPMLSRVNPGTGEVEWAAKIPRGSKYEASPLAADGRIYVINFGGDVTVVDAENGSIITTIPMDEEGHVRNRSSIVAAQGHLFIRAGLDLFCIGRAHDAE